MGLRARFEAQLARQLGHPGGLGLKLLLNAADNTVVHGVEVSSSMIRGAQTRFGDEIRAQRLQLHLASIAQLPLGDASLDGVITVNTLYFVPDLDRAFDELARVLRSSGRLVIGFGDPEAMSELAFTAHGFRLRAVDEISSALTAAGLTVVDHRRVGDARIQSHILIAQPG